MNKTNSLVALCLLLLVIGALTRLKALFEVLERSVKLITLLEVDGDDLVNTDQLAGDLTLDLCQARFHGLLKGSLQMVHGLEDVQNFLFTDTETLVSLSLTFSMLGLDGYVQAPLVEIGSGLPIVKLLELLGNAEILLEAVLDVVLSLKVLRLLKVI